MESMRILLLRTHLQQVSSPIHDMHPEERPLMKRVNKLPENQLNWVLLKGPVGHQVVVTEATLFLDNNGRYDPEHQFSESDHSTGAGQWASSLILFGCFHLFD